MREAGRQAVASEFIRGVHLHDAVLNLEDSVDARHKPEGVADSGKAGGGSGKTQNLSSSLGMSVEEAQLILNVKKGDSMEKILEVSIWMYSFAISRLDKLIVSSFYVELRTYIQGKRQT